MKGKIKKWLWNYANDESYKLEQDDFDILLEDYKKKSEKISKKFVISDFNDINRITSSLHMIHLQKEMEKSNRGLKWATYFLASATIVLTISTVWGQEVANNFVNLTINRALTFFGVVIALGFALGILNIISKKVIKYILSRKKNEK